jgi:Helix-turn-helix domain of resolvase
VVGRAAAIAAGEWITASGEWVNDPAARAPTPGGIAKAKAAGIYKGRPASIDGARVRELKAGGMGPTDIAKALKIGRASVYRVLDTTPS